MKIITAACHEEIRPHFHLQTSGWTHVPGKDKPVFIVRVDYHDPKAGPETIGVSIPIEAP